MMRFLILILTSCLLIGLFSCSSYNRLYEKGNYKSVIRSLKNKALKGSLKNDEIDVFEKALQADLLNQLKLLNNHLASNNFEDWKEGFSYLDNLEKRQEQYLDYPQVNTEEMEFVDIKYWDQAFGDKLYAHHISNYNESYEKYLETNDKNHVIDAYYELEKVDYFERSNLNTDSLLHELSELGKRTFEVKFYDQDFSAWELEQLKNNVRLVNNKWSEFEASNPYDYTVSITLNNLEKDNNYSQIQRQYTNEVITGYNAQTDQEGNIVQIPIIETYTATVNETTFNFIVDTRVEVEIVNSKTRKRVAYERFTERIYDERREGYLVNGDLRAIPLDVDISSRSALATSNQYDYTDLTETLMRNVGRQIKDFIERY